MPKGRGRKDSDSDAATEEQSTVGTFETLRDEGEHFVHVKQYQKAIESFSKALEMKPGDKTCLVTRSKCYLMLGNSQAALADAEAALEQDEEEGKKDIRALCMKAEALYQKGDFETALVYYHRGNKLRPELQEFRLGIQKSQEAINNSIGTPDAVRLEASGDLSFFYKQEEKQKQQQQKGYSKPQTQKREEKKERGKPQGTGSSKTTKELLGELHKDKAYLDKLYDSMVSNSTDTDEYIKGRAADGLEYLNTRADFWRQQKPMYARKRDRQRKQQQNAGSRTDPHGEQDPMQYILEQLEKIDDAQANGKYDESLKKAQNTLKKVESWGNDRVKNKPALVANLYSCMGNAYLELNKFKEALDCHNKDLSIGEEENIEEAVSRALDNLGRTKAKMGKYEDAIEIWEKKLPKTKSALESTWLFHEIGRCYLELGQYSNAKDYGEKSFAAAKEADDRGWQLHASVLVAQAEVKCEELEAAVDSFERAKEIAEELKDDSAQLAIKKALEEVNTRIVKGETVDYKDEDAGADDDGRRSVKSDVSGGSTKGGLRKGHEDKAEDPKDKHAKDRANEEMRDHEKEEDGNQEKELEDSPQDEAEEEAYEPATEAVNDTGAENSDAQESNQTSCEGAAEERQAAEEAS